MLLLFDQRFQPSQLKLLFYCIFVITISANNGETSSNSNPLLRVGGTLEVSSEQQQQKLLQYDDRSPQDHRRDDHRPKNRQQQRQRQRHADGRTLIVGGEIVQNATAKFPAFAWTGIGSGGWGCGGALIHEDIVLTASHCHWVYDQQHLWIGPNDIHGYDGEFHQVQDVLVHPNALVNGQNDLMLVKLETPSKRRPFFVYNTNRNKPDVDDPVTMIGFGVTAEINATVSEQLRQVTVNAYPYGICNETYHETITVVDDIHICAGTKIGGKDACNSDSGSPIIAAIEKKNAEGNNNNDDHHLVVVGIVGDGKGCGLPNIPSINVRVSGFANWITQSICDLSSYPPDNCNVQ